LQGDDQRKQRIVVRDSALLKTVTKVLVDAIIRTRTRNFCHACPPTRNNTNFRFGNTNRSLGVWTEGIYHEFMTRIPAEARDIAHARCRGGENDMHSAIFFTPMWLLVAVRPLKAGAILKRHYFLCTE
jgi:hypothetical protein